MMQGTGEEISLFHNTQGIHVSVFQSPSGKSPPTSKNCVEIEDFLKILLIRLNHITCSGLLVKH